MYAISIPNLVEIRKVNLNSLLISPGMTHRLGRLSRADTQDAIDVSMQLHNYRHRKLGDYKAG